jgi:hypothetical protein
MEQKDRSGMSSSKQTGQTGLSNSAQIGNGAVQNATPRASWRASGLTLRALLLGLAFTALCDLWIHWAELVLGGRGHTALANTSIPVGAFNILFLLVIVNLFLTRVLRPLAFSRAELLVIYVMMTVSTVISSSGGIHFIVPTVTAAFWYADGSNGWAGLFHQFIPGWIAQRNRAALHDFYIGNAHVPWAEWRVQMLSWCGFLAIFALASLCIVTLLRRQWVDRERLAFPTVAVPIELMRDPENLLGNRVFQLGFALPFLVDVMNTAHLNFPAIPYFPTRTADQPDLGTFFNAPPFNAIGNTPISLYPFVIGIAYLLSVEMTFSCWFFWLLTKLEAVLGAASGLTAGATGGGQSSWPFLGHQGAGAFLALTLVGLWLSRSYLKEVWTLIVRQRGGDGEEPMPYRLAFAGLILCFALLVGWCVVAGMRGLVASALILLSLLYMIAATRIRAETGNAWLFGPEIDAYKVMTTTFGTTVYHAADLTILAYVRNAVASNDLRCLSMPNQFDAYKMAGTLEVDRRRLTVALILSIVVGAAISFAIALMVWYAFGAGAKTDSWRTSMGRMPFDQLADTLKTPVKPDLSGTAAIAGGFAVTTALMLLRTRYIWWVFHPVGYAMANTPTMNQIWLPFFIAWLLKTLVLRYGGIRLYRLSLPLFYGLIIGDFIAGGLTTLLGCVTGINVYATNW